MRSDDADDDGKAADDQDNDNDSAVHGAMEEEEGISEPSSCLRGLLTARKGMGLLCCLRSLRRVRAE